MLIHVLCQLIVRNIPQKVFYIIVRELQRSYAFSKGIILLDRRHMVILIVQVALDVLVADPGKALCYICAGQSLSAGRCMQTQPADGKDKAYYNGCC